jgi:hypothetical protein
MILLIVSFLHAIVEHAGVITFIDKATRPESRARDVHSGTRVTCKAEEGGGKSGGRDDAGIHCTHCTFTDITHQGHQTSRAAYIKDIKHQRHHTSKTTYIKEITHQRQQTSRTSHIKDITHQ